MRHSIAMLYSEVKQRQQVFIANTFPKLLGREILSLGLLPAFREGLGYEASEIIDSTFLSLKTNRFMNILVTTVYGIADILHYYALATAVPQAGKLISKFPT